jgi:hypothetical protein
MEWFSRHFKKVHAENNAPTQIEKRLEELIGLKVPSCDGIGLSPVSKLPAKVFILMQVGLRRTIELTQAAMREMNGQDVSSTCVLVRATLETACLLWEVMRQVKAAVDKGDAADVEELDRSISSTLLGGKSKNWALSAEIAAKNVLTIIQKLTKQMDVPLEGFYEGLSEHAHPNYHGMMATYTESGHKGGITIFTNHREGRTEASTTLALGALATSLDIVKHALAIRTELSDRFSTLVERKIYERGTWPADVEYPVER